MRFLTMVFDENSDVSFALVNIDSDLSKYLLSSKELLQMVMSRDKNAVAIAAADYSCEFYENDISEEGDLEQSLGEESWKEFQEKRMVSVPPEFLMPSSCEQVSTDSDFLYFEEKGFYWQAHPKYGAGLYESEVFLWEILLPKKDGA